MNLVALLFSFQGRINRNQYWLGSMGAGLIGFIAFFAITLMSASPADAPKGAATPGMLTSLLTLPVMVALTWAGLALQVKRFHDRGRSGYFVLAPLLPWVIIVTTIASAVAIDAPPASVVGSILPWFGVLVLINLFLLVDLGMLAGTPGPNKYDPPSTPPGMHPGGPKAPPVASLAGAESAMDRAIAAQARSFAPDRAPAPQTASPGGFGRKVSS